MTMTWTCIESEQKGAAEVLCG